MKRATTVAVILLVLAVSAWYWWRPSGREGGVSRINTVAAALGDAAGIEGFARASEPRTFVFPADHGPHPDFRNEWWYFTGNLESADGRRFGYQLTFFRIALAPEVPTTGSRWRTNQLYMAHFAVSDFASESHHGFQRFGRGAAGLAGARNPPLQVWLDHWELQAEDPSGFPLRLTAAESGLAIDLRLVPEKPIVLNGDRGLSRKSAEAGNASYYYSATRLSTEGDVRLGAETFEVSGNSWLDREWSTSALAADQQGWDWFALQLEDGRDLMLYRLRRTDGSADPASAGTLVDSDGEARHLVADDMDFEVLDHWRSPESGIRYPRRWQLNLPRDDLVLEVIPEFDNQEMDVVVRYWEGAVRVQGRQGDRPLAGRGYMELAGYGERRRHDGRQD